MDWDIALERQAAALRSLTYLEDKSFELMGGSRGFKMAGVLNDFRRACIGQDVIYVDRDITNLFLQEVQGVPDNWFPTADQLLSTTSFCWFSHPVAYHNFQGEQILLEGYAWVPIENGLHIASFSTSTGFTAARGYPVGPLASYLWPWHQPLKEVGQYERIHSPYPTGLGPPILDNGVADWDLTLRFWALLVEFMNQKIVERRYERPSRPTRRRLGYTPETCPLITVITLRRKKYAKAELEAEATWHYSHRFIVRSHWRRQWFPSLGIHRPVLISSYVKGPEDTPLVVKRRVFNVSR